METIQTNQDALKKRIENEVRRAFEECKESAEQGKKYDSIDDESQVIEGGLSYENAKTLFEELLKTNYGVEIIDENPDNMEPIILIKTNLKTNNNANH